MTDTPVVPIPAIESVPVAAPAPTPVVAPVEAVTPTPTPAPVETPVQAEKPVTLLADGLDKTPPQAPEPAPTVQTVEPTAPVKDTTEGQTDDPAPPPSTSEVVVPSYEPFTFPEGTTLEPDRVGKFTEILSELETGGKVPHDLMQQFGQKAVDFHVSEVNRVVEDYNKSLQAAWGKQKDDWREQVIKDPELGGNRLDATIDAALGFIRTHGGSPEQQTEFRNLMESSGLGNHPAVIRLFANASRALAEGKPLVATRPAPAPKSKTQTLYGNK